MKSSLDELLTFVNLEAAKLTSLRERLNAATDDPDMQFADTHVSAETRAFALSCLTEYIRRTERRTH